MQWAAKNNTKWQGKRKSEYRRKQEKIDIDECQNKKYKKNKNDGSKKCVKENFASCKVL